MNTNVSILAEIPEDLHLSMQGYLDGNPDWDQDRVFSAAISLFLLQNTVENSPEASLNYRRAARVYLETLFRNETETSQTSSNEFDAFDPLDEVSADSIASQSTIEHPSKANSIEPQPTIGQPPKTDIPLLLDPRDSQDPQDPRNQVDAA